MVFKYCLNLNYSRLINQISQRKVSTVQYHVQVCTMCSRSTTYRLTVSRGVALVEQELPTIPEFTHHFSGVRVAQSFVFCVVLYGSLFDLLYFFILLFFFNCILLELCYYNIVIAYILCCVYVLFVFVFCTLCLPFL